MTIVVTFFAPTIFGALIIDGDNDSDGDVEYPRTHLNHNDHQRLLGTPPPCPSHAPPYTAQGSPRILCLGNDGARGFFNPLDTLPLILSDGTGSTLQGGINVIKP